MYSAKSTSRLIALPLFTLIFTLAFTEIVGGVVEASHLSKLPDLVVSAVRAPSVAQPGQNLVLSASVRNLGRVSAGASQAAFYLTKGTSSITGATLLGTQNMGSLPAGTTLALTTTLSIPSSTSSGRFYVIAVADPSNAAKESNETNNTRASRAITIKDLTRPTISAVNATQITVDNATITWTTDEASTSLVEYGTTAAYGHSASPDSALTTSHAVTLSGLTAGMVYHFRVQSNDAAGNVAISSDYTFTTATATATTETETAGNIYFVAPTGSDANPGTDALPFRTLARGVRVLTPGDTLYIKSGTYPEALLDSIPSGTSWDSPVTVAAAPGQTVTLKPAAGAAFVLHFQGPQQYIVIDGLVLDATNVTYDAVKITSGGGSPAHHIRLIQCEIKNAPGQGVLVSRSADWNEFVELNVHDNGSNKWDHGFYISTSHNLVEDSTIHHNTGYGVHVYNEHTGEQANNNIVRNNRIFENGHVDGGAGIILGSGDGNTAYNNLVWGNAAGIKVAYLNPSNTQVYNNTVYANSAYGIYVHGDSGNASIKNNLFYANGLPEIQNNGARTVLDRNLTGINPKFVNASVGDFRLQPGSPAIDAGDVVSVVTTDIEETARPQGGSHDAGAYEAMIP